MYIQNVTCNSFYGTRSSFVYGRKHNRAVQGDVKEKFYEDIDNYLDYKCNKYKYFCSLRNHIKNLENLNDFTEAERQYLDELIATIDDVGGIKKIPDEYLRTLMSNLKAKKKAQ